MLFSILPALILSAAPAPGDMTQAELEALSHEILAAIEELRGDEYTRDVKVSIADKAGFLEYADDRMERTTSENQLRSDELVMKLAGLVDPKMDYMGKLMSLLESQVGGFYDPATESFCLMSSFQGGIAKIILAHELTHALDDQLWDIDGTLDRLAGNADAQMAYQAVVEGSGTSTMNEWTLKHFGKDVSMKDLAGASELDTGGLEDAPASLWKPMLMVYMKGAAFLKRTDNVMAGQMGGVDRADLERAFTDPPTSTEQILHPEKYWDEATFDAPTRLRLDTSKLEADGWSLINQETLGEATLALVTAPESERGGLDTSNPMAMMGLRYTNKAAEGWDGDRYALLEKDGMLFFHLTTVWDSEKDAAEFAENVGRQAEVLGAARNAMSSNGRSLSNMLTRGNRVDLVTWIGAPEGASLAELDAGIEVLEVLEPLGVEAR